jgi:hypothetical protein
MESKVIELTHPASAVSLPLKTSYDDIEER